MEDTVGITVTLTMTTVASVIIVAKVITFSRFDRNYTVITYQHTVQNVIMYRKLRL